MLDSNSESELLDSDSDGWGEDSDEEDKNFNVEVENIPSIKATRTKTVPVQGTIKWSPDCDLLTDLKFEQNSGLKFEPPVDGKPIDFFFYASRGFFF